MASNRASYILPALFLLCVFAGVVGGAGYLLKMMYDSKKAGFEKAIQELAPFNEEKALEGAAAEFGVKLPLQDVKESPEAIHSKIETAIKEECSKTFPAKEVSAQNFAIIKRYSTAKPGDEIKFQLTDASMVSGSFKRVEDGGASGRFAVIARGTTEFKYPLIKIMPEYYYLFTEGDSSATAKKALAKIKEELGTQKKALSDAMFKALEPKLFEEAGYIRREEGWVPSKDNVLERVESLRRQFAKERARKIEALKKEFSLFGIVMLEPPHKPKNPDKGQEKP